MIFAFVTSALFIALSMMTVGMMRIRAVITVAALVLDAMLAVVRDVSVAIPTLLNEINRPAARTISIAVSTPV